MLVLIIGTAISVPNLAGFARGRRLTDDARRLWALTRYARELALTQAVPIAVWVDADTQRYGLDAVPGYGHSVAPLVYALGADLEVLVDADSARRLEADAGTMPRLVWWPDGSLADGANPVWILRDRRHPAIAWRLVRQAPLSTFTLTREVDG